MAYIFLDESGDLGFKPKSSKWFIITIVFTENHRKIEKIIKKVRKQLKNNFEKYLRNSLAKKGQKKINIQIKPSHAEKCLQAVDFISWAIFRKYEIQDESYYDIIQSKIIEENLLFK